VNANTEAMSEHELPAEIAVATEDQIHRTLQEAEHALGSSVIPSGTMVFDVSAHLVSGTKSGGG